MRVLVCGGRDFCDWKKLNGTLTNLHKQNITITTLIQGKAIGADWLARAWGIAALGKDYVIDFPADWKKHGRGAGPIRNQQMLDEGKPDLVVAFPGGNGTKDMVTRAKNAGVKVIEVE